jgi:hypothetical protein
VTQLFIHFHVEHPLICVWKLKYVPLQNQSVHPRSLKLVSTLNRAHVYSIKSHMQLLILYDGKSIIA